MTPTPAHGAASIQLAARAGPPIVALGGAYMLDDATSQRGAALGLDLASFYGLGRGAVLGDADPDVIAAAFPFISIEVVRAVIPPARAALPPAQAVVVRGGDLDPEVLRADAQRYHSIYGAFGISVFAAREIAVDELAQQPPLVRFEVLTLVRVGALRAAGFRPDPTGRNPRHFTVAFDDLDTGIAALRACEHLSWFNPYHEY